MSVFFRPRTPVRTLSPHPPAWPARWPCRRFLPVLLLLAAGSSLADVALDVGHSLQRPGVTTASGRSEFSLNRALATAVARQLQARGIAVRQVGSDGHADVLTNRTAAAADSNLLVSLHHDSVRQDWLADAARYHGFSLFVSHRNPQPAESLACARLIGKRLQAAGFVPSRYHAQPVRGENRPFADEAAGVHWFDDLVVLRSARSPAVLLEAGVVVNPADERLVTGEAGRARLSAAIATGIADCLERGP